MVWWVWDVPNSKQRRKTVNVNVEELLVLAGAERSSVQACRIMTELDLIQVLLDGSVLKVRGIGKTGYRQLCRVVEAPLPWFNGARLVRKPGELACECRDPNCPHCGGER